MPEISNNKRNTLLMKDKINKYIFETKTKNDNNDNYLLNEHELKRNKTQILSKSKKNKNSIQSKLITKIDFLFKLLIFINLYFHISPITITTSFKKIKQKYKILNYKFFKSPSSIKINDVSYGLSSSNTFASNSNITGDGTSLFYNSNGGSGSNSFVFSF